jgi:hypothetical protein
MPANSRIAAVSEPPLQQANARARTTINAVKEIFLDLIFFKKGKQ